jgi:hypothetical protein
MVRGRSAFNCYRNKGDAIQIGQHQFALAGNTTPLPYVIYPHAVSICDCIHRRALNKNLSHNPRLHLFRPAPSPLPASDSTYDDLRQYQ